MLRRTLLLFPLLLTLLLALGARAQVLQPTTLATALSKPSARVGEELDLIVTARIEDKWHLYATDFDPDLGPTVFAFTFAKSPAYELVGKPKSIGSTRHYDDVFKGNVTYFEKTGRITQRIRVLQPGTLTITAETEFQSCTDVDGRCIPGEESLRFGPITVTGPAAPATTVPGAATTVPGAAATVPDAATTVPGPDAGVPGSAATVPGPDAIVPGPDATVPGPDAGVPGAATTVSGAAAVVPGVATTVPDAATVVPGVAAAVPGAESGLWGFALLAFLSGLGALLTPCVFPLIPMTVSIFTKGSANRRQGILKALVYGLSIIFIYVVVGLLTTVLLGADGLNLISTHWLPNLIFFAVFVVFGLSFLGLFEITLPHGMVNKIDEQADKGGWAGVFFMALTLVVVSFSCTGPIVASILTMAAQGERMQPVIGMLGFSLAFALPFMLFALFPTWLKSLPSSGGWLNTVKVTLGFVELMLALKFLSMADLAYHWNLLPRDIYLVLWIALSGLLGLYLLGRFKLSHDSDLSHLSVGRLLMAVLAFSFMTYLVPGLFGAPLPLLAGYLPPQSRNDFSLATAGEAPAVPAGNTPAAQCETPRYAGFLELPHGLQGFFDLEQAKRCAKALNKPLFIDFTGHACVNCRKMEATVWKDPEVLRRLRNDFVVVALYVDDKTELPRTEWYTSAHDQKEKTTLGKKNADLQLTGFNVNAQPFYVLLDPNAPADLAHTLTPPVAYESDVTKFIQFLDAGLARYRQQVAAR